MARAPAAFDFEASALGVGADDGGAAYGADAGGDVATAAALPTLPKPSQTRYGAQGARGSGAGAGEAADEAGPASAARLAAALLGHGGLMERLGREAVEVRRQLDHALAEKGRLEEHIEEARARREALLRERHAGGAELARRRADLEHLASGLEFARGQIGEAEREVGQLAQARRAFSSEELERAERKYGRLAGPGVAPGDRELARAAALALQRRQAEELGRGGDLHEGVRRALRRRLDLQARWQKLLADRHQAEQDRSEASRALQRGRAALASVQEQRLAAAEELHGAAEAAARLAAAAGLGPLAVRELAGGAAAPAAAPPPRPPPRGAGGAARGGGGGAAAPEEWTRFGD